MRHKKLLDLEDFGDPLNISSAEKVGNDMALAEPEEKTFEEEVLFPEKIHHFTEAELESIKEGAYQRGRKEAEEQFENVQKENYDALSLKMKEELERFSIEFKNKIEEITNLFFDFSYEFVEEILHFPEDELKAVKNVILDEVINFIQSSEEKLTINCHPDDRNLLEKSLSTVEHVSFELHETYQRGDFRIISQNSVFVLSSEEWKKRVFQKILDSVSSLMQQYRREHQKDISQGDDK